MDERHSVTSAGHPRSPWRFLAAASLLLYLGTMLIISRSDLQLVFEPPLLLPIMNTIFAGLIPITVSIIAARTYLYSGLNSVLFMGCGMMTFGCGAVLAGWLIGGSQGPNVNVTIYNTGALLGSIFHLFSAIIKYRNTKPDALPERRKIKLILAYTGMILFMFFLAVVTLWGITPKFFIQGVGPTILRQLVLGTAVLLFLLSGLIIMSIFTKRKLSFQYWYSLSLIMIALGLLAFFLQKSVGSPIGWLGRLGQYIGGIYALIAVLITVKSARNKGISMQNAMAGLFRDAELSYHALVETVMDPIISFNQDGSIIQWNTAAEKLFGYRQNEAVGSSLFDVVIGEAFTEIFRNQLSNLDTVNDRLKVGRQLDITGKAKDGSTIPVEVSTSAMKSRDKWSFVCVFRDVTERKKAEADIRRLNEDLELRVEERTEELRNERQRLAGIIKGTNAGTWEWNVQTGEAVFNERWAEIIGYTLEEISPVSIATWMNFAHPDDLKESGELLEKHFRGEIDYYEFESRMKHLDGNWIWVLDRGKVSTWTEEGKPLLMLGTHQDITSRKQAAQELEAKNSELERFTYTVSHDLKSPLITIQYFTGQVLQDLKAGHQNDVDEDLKKITDAASKMTNLLDDLLELSRVGRIMNPSTEIDMVRLVEEICAQLAGLIRQRQVTMTVQKDLPVAHGDRQRIVEVMQNLVENAIKYMGDQPEPRIEIGSRDNGKNRVFFVSDNGIGIDSCYHEKIFGLFNKLDASNEGTGVGLALVKRIIELHGGTVWVESEGVGKGSRFCFTLPEELMTKSSGEIDEPQHG